MPQFFQYVFSHLLELPNTNDDILVPLPLQLQCPLPQQEPTVRDQVHLGHALPDL